MWNKCKNKMSQVILVIFLLQGIMGFVVLGSYVLASVSDWQVNKSIIIIYCIVNVLGILGIKYIVDLLAQEVDYQRLLVKLQKSDEVLFALRAHKHDFFNHLQIIMGLAQLNQKERIISYVRNISQDVSQSYDIANINIPEIAVVLMQKLGEATQRGIRVETQITTNCEGLRGEGINYAQILFNLLDNAIFELDRLKDCGKVLKVDIREDNECFKFIIYNNLPIISKENQEQLFERGFTTKKGEHDGLGLWNVKRLVHMNGGIIEVESRPDYGTAFNIIISK